MKIEKHVFSLKTIRQTNTGRYVYTDMRDIAGRLGKEFYTDDIYTALNRGVFEELAPYYRRHEATPERYAAEHIMSNTMAIGLAQLGLTGKVPTSEKLSGRYSCQDNDVFVTVAPDGLTITVEYHIAETYAETPVVVRYTKRLRDTDKLRLWVDTCVVEDEGDLVTHFIKRCHRHIKHGMGIPDDVLDNLDWLIAYAADYGL